jgi:heme oxygenase
VLWRIGRYLALLSGGQIMRRIQRGAMGLRDAEGGAIFTFAEVPTYRPCPALQAQPRWRHEQASYPTPHACTAHSHSPPLVAA